MKKIKRFLNFSKRIINAIREISFVMIPILILILLICPVSALMLDILMSVNLLFALVFLLTALHTRKAADFSIYPTMLLLSIIFCLAVNIAAVRLILTKGEAFDGKMIKIVSSLFAGSGSYSLGIGFSIFIAIIAVQAVVTARGLTRVTEVAERFTSDSLEIKMTSIETEYASGSISEDETTDRKNELQREADFFCSLDGVCRFIYGSEKVKIFIAAAGIIGGILIGLKIKVETISNDAIRNYITLSMLRIETVSDTLRTYISLSIANASFFIVHSFLISLTVGIIVTRMVSSVNNIQD